MKFILKIVITSLVTLIVAVTICSAQEIDKKKQNVKSTSNKESRKKPVFDPANHPIEIDSILKMKKRADKGDAEDYKEYMKVQTKTEGKTTEKK